MREIPKVCCQVCSQHSGFSCPHCGGKEWEIAFRKDVVASAPMIGRNSQNAESSAYLSWNDAASKKWWQFWK